MIQSAITVKITVNNGLYKIIITDSNPINKTNYKFTVNNIKMIETMKDQFLRNTNDTLNVEQIAKNIVKGNPKTFKRCFLKTTPQLNTIKIIAVCTK